MLLKKGSSGADVVRLQQLLGISADGIYGSGTENAVKNFQASKGLTADGIAGDQTLTALGWYAQSGSGNSGSNPGGDSGSSLKLDKLKGVIPDQVLAQIPDTAKRFSLSSNLRLAHFLAQCAHESGNFSAVSENLNYSADGLLKIFPKYFNSTTAAQYARQPIKIGSRVYANRMGNGDEASGEGYKFRGRGYIQLTGKANYQAFGTSISTDLTSNPDLVATTYPMESAAYYFQKNNLWAICDKGNSDAVVTELTKRINGGTNGLDDRLTKFRKFYGILCS